MSKFWLTGQEKNQEIFEISTQEVKKVSEYRIEIQDCQDSDFEVKKVSRLWLENVFSIQKLESVSILIQKSGKYQYSEF